MKDFRERTVAGKKASLCKELGAQEPSTTPTGGEKIEERSKKSTHQLLGGRRGTPRPEGLHERMSKNTLLRLRRRSLTFSGEERGVRKATRGRRRGKKGFGSSGRRDSTKKQKRLSKVRHVEFG